MGPEPARAPFGQEVVEEELRTYMTGCDTALAYVRAESEQGTPVPGSGDIHVPLVHVRHKEESPGTRVPTPKRCPIA